MSTTRHVTTRRTREVRDLINRFGRMIAGQEPDQFGLAETFWSAVAYSLLDSIHRAFLIKSAHGTDELGQKWPDLDPKTKAYSRPDARVGIPLPGPKSRPTLTKEQDKEWAYIFASSVAWFRTQMDEDEAKIAAAKLAWATLKTHGAKTLLELTASRSVPLLQKSMRLIHSLSPGIFSGRRYTPPPDQIFRMEPGRLTIGTSVEYASKVAEKRPFWPADIDPWIERALNAGIDAVIIRIREIL